MDLKQLYDSPPWEWPGNATAIIYKAVSEPGHPESDRLMALELAGEPIVINDRLAEVLMAILQNGREPEEIRCQAVIALGAGLEAAYLEEVDIEDDFLTEINTDEIGEGLSSHLLKKIQEKLSRLYRDAEIPERVRRRILEVSVRAPWDWHKNAVTAAYYSGDNDWRLTSVFCMGYLPGFNEELIEALRDPDQEISLEAVSSAVNHGLSEALPKFKDILLTSPSSDKELLLRAIELVPEVCPEQAGEMLSSLLDDQDREVATAVLDALALAEMMMELDDDEDY
ncbi:MAG: HEAT repeat domain-containing protein [Desulfosudaceae bacterium]